MSKVIIWCLLIVSYTYVLVDCSEETWPVYPIYYSNRSKVAVPDSYCEGLFPFCPAGISHIPTFGSGDTIEVFAMKKPVWQFITGNFMGKLGIWHDAIGLRSKKTGLNFTVEWYELYELLNCTFPHIVDNRTSPLWCNQGAACFYRGIIDKLWLSNGSITKVTEMTSKQFFEWGKWLKLDNDTGPYYETWRVKEGTKREDQEWFVPFDCASFILRSFKAMKKVGAEFNQNVKLNYSFITLCSDEPIFLANEADIFGPNKHNDTLAKTLMDWYDNFQSHHKNIVKWFESILKIFDYFEIEHEFYLYYNKAYWFLPLKHPIIDITYEYVPLP
ncbi:hypothetical protein LOD99_1992 [Oopsacas minuta]|uniref:Bis(monoacylglycero)phosphate synthase CLN5 n=1 Tax=Oopsacas minuta TaxID=111878 RepID=A0AAV7K3Z4_9METZ|nr:hypothetical protein LOD99_1992 [Oopsacas minuta]